MSRRGLPLPGVALGLLVLATPLAAQAQVPPLLTAPDARFVGDPSDLGADAVWKFAASLGGSKTTGNSRSSQVNLSGEAARITDDSKLSLAVRGLYAENNDTRTAANIYLNTQYDRDFSRDWFGFGKFDALRDHPANIDQRQSAYGGIGYHVFRTSENTWDISGGVGYTDDRYVRPTMVAGEMRDQYGRIEAVLAESSSHKLTDTTSFRQKLGVFPNLKDGGEYRVVFDAGLSVAINATLSLTAGLTWRYDSQPGTALQKVDAVYVTGIGFKWD